MHCDNSIYFQIPKIEKEGVVVQYENLDHFYDHLHYHPELQLIYILEGTGDLFIGDSVRSFEPDMLFLLGSNQSHILKSDPGFFQPGYKKKSRSISIFFHEQSLGEGFFDITETIAIKKLIDRADRSLVFAPKVASTIGERMRKLMDKSGFDRFLETLSILNKLALTDNYKFLASIANSQPPSDKESARINNIINYILTHYKEDIKLETIAKIGNYSKTSFCRFFKQRTRKTFTQFLNEVRVSKACKMLRNTELNISQICFESGFNNVSNFNRQFKRINDLTPKEYSKKFKKMSSSPHVITYS